MTCMITFKFKQKDSKKKTVKYENETIREKVRFEEESESGLLVTVMIGHQLYLN